MVCRHIDNFLSSILHIWTILNLFNSDKVSNVVSVHCLAGKGRTGTAICCYLIYSGRFISAEEALTYYAKKRLEYFFKIIKASSFWKGSKLEGELLNQVKRDMWNILKK